MRKILVLRGGALGDFLVTLPALALLRRRWPATRIELVGNATAAALAVTRGLLDATHSQHEARWSALFSAVPLPSAFSAWLADFDLVLNYWPDANGDLSGHFPLHPRQTFLSASAMPARSPAAAHYCEPLRALGIQPEHFWFHLNPIAPPHAGKLPPSGLIAASAPGPVAIHPGSGSPTKNWPAGKWLELIDRLAHPVLLILGEAETRRSAFVPTRFGSQVRILVQPRLETLITELHACCAFAGHDSGVSHLAAACGLPCVLLFGPTDPAMWAPPVPHVQVLHHGADLSGIRPDEVLDALKVATTATRISEANPRVKIR